MFISTLFKHWHTCDKNREVDVKKNSEFAKFECGITYSRDMLNHKMTNCKVDYIKYEFGDQIRLFEQLFKNYNIDRSNENVVQILVLWIECFVREYRGETPGEVGDTVEEYIRMMKLEFFPTTKCTTRLMSDLYLNNFIENIEIIKMRQKIEEIYAFNPEYLERYLDTLKYEVRRRRSLIFKEKKSPVLR